ncbi:MAG: hypothetical protein ACT4P3_07285 [Betaproteobacteria bacterium]
MMDGGMGSMMNSMMGWMMGIGLLGWVLVIALLVTIVVLLFRLLSREGRGPDDGSSGPGLPTDRSPTP